MKNLIFPPEAQLTIDHINKVGQHLDIYARSRGIEAICPDCHAVSTRVHSRYWRHPKDLPSLGLTVRLHIEVHRFACLEKGCLRKTFAEQFTGLLNPQARRTIRLREHHLAIAYALGGEAGCRLSYFLGMPISGDTLIREIRLAPEVTASAVRVVGVDDWAMKKGCVYGTILVDLEKRQPIDLLPTREADVVAAWFQAHPETEIISRDRGKEYVKAATEGAPQAQQVADRWHLLKNLREAVATFLQQKPACLLAAARIPDIRQEKEHLATEWGGNKETMTGTDTPIVSKPDKKSSLTKTEQDKAARHARRRERYDHVRELKQAGYSNRAIGRHMKMSTRTVSKYIEADTCPQYPPRRVRESKLSPWIPYLEQRWQTGCTNASQLWREIQGKDFSCSLGLVNRWAVVQRTLLPAENRYSRQQANNVKPALSRRQHPVPWSAQRASWLVILDDDKLDDDEKAARMRILTADTEIVAVNHLVRQFIQMVKERRSNDLSQWLDDVAESGIKPLKSFANGIRRDLKAVRNALSMIWSNGQTEGQINRLKFIKRQMYGRANFDLLRKRVLYQSSYG